MRISDWSSDVCSSDLALRIADRKDVGVDRPLQRRLGAGALDVVDEAGVVHLADEAVGEPAGGQAAEQVGLVELAEDGADPHRRLDVAAVLQRADRRKVGRASGREGGWHYG